jgi:hypothetical protein
VTPSGAPSVILHEVMQHVDEPLDLLVEVHDLLVRHGLAFLMFTPWGSPCGANTADLLPAQRWAISRARRRSWTAGSTTLVSVWPHQCWPVPWELGSAKLRAVLKVCL